MRWILILLLLCSCVTYKDNRALNRVTAKRDLLDKAFVEGLKIHPCANDTVIVSVKGDTVIDIVNKVINDTIYKELTKYITKTQIVEKIVVDKAQNSIYNDTINKLKCDVANKDGVIAQQNSQIKDSGRKITNLYIIIGGIITVIAVWITLKIKK